MKSLVLILLAFCLSHSSFAQRRQIEIQNADKMVGDKTLRKLYGNVAFKHQKTTMFCDSAYFYAQDNMFEAFGHIKIIDNSVVITADTLFYNSKTAIAKLRGKVVMTDKEMTLTTKFLDYNTKEQIGYYYNSGTIINKENTLSSMRGVYYSHDNTLFFKQSVTLVNIDYTIHTDTLKYNTNSETSYFFGPTTINSDKNLLYTENGWYNSQTDIAQFYENSYLNSKSQFIYGNNLHYNRNTDIGIAKGNVCIKDTSQQVSIYGLYGYYNGEQKNMYVSQEILMIKEFEYDSLFLHADSIHYKTLHTSDSTDYFMIQAYNKVRFFKSDVQGVCDSLVYHSQDSTITLITEPIIWSEENQITGKEIVLQIENEELRKIIIEAESFLASEDSNMQYNQMKGRTLVGYIHDNELYKVDIFHNGETIYYLRDDIEMVGINKATCDSITVHISNGKAQKIIFRSQPNGTLFPPEKVNPETMQLHGFSWYDHIRPRDKDDIYIWRK